MSRTNKGIKDAPAKAAKVDKARRQRLVNEAHKPKGPSKIQAFDYGLDFEHTDLREHPELYRIGKGEQGVLMVEPYKGEILPHWRFKNPEIATESSAKIYQLFEDYLDQDDFVGADMARKFLQMGYTRSRRYANHRSGRKYKTNPQKAPTASETKALRQDILPNEPDPIKAKSAEIFKAKWKQAEADPRYQQLRAEHLKKYP